MRLQGDVIEGEKTFRYVRLMSKHIQPGSGNTLVDQGIEQRRFIHQLAARHIDEIALWPQRLQHRLTDDDFAAISRGRKHQHVHFLRQRVNISNKGVIKGGNRGKVGIQNAGIEGGNASGNGLTNTPHADNPHRRASDFARQRQVGLRPAPRTDDLLADRKSVV